MIKFRQLIRPGQRGRDVKAVKRAMIKMGVKGAGSMGKTNKAGPEFVKCLKNVQRNHGLHVDGIYGKKTHAVIAPHFDAYSKLLYRTAKIRKPPMPPMSSTDAKVYAQRLLGHHNTGKYIANNSGDLRDIQRTAQGLPVWSAEGRWIHIDYRPLKLLCYLIEVKGHKIGTYALCSDHFYDGPHGHAGGLAVDIDEIDGTNIASSSARAKTLELAKEIHNLSGDLHPWQEICGGYGYMRDSAISAESIPSADSFYGSTTMRQHTNHIHVGYYRNL